MTKKTSSAVQVVAFHSTVYGTPIVSPGKSRPATVIPTAYCEKQDDEAPLRAAQGRLDANDRCIGYSRIQYGGIHPS